MTMRTRGRMVLLALVLLAWPLAASSAAASTDELRTHSITLQEYDFSCGAAVISTILTYYFGEPVTEQEVILGIARETDMAKVLTRRAFSLLDMKRFAQARGYQAVGYRMDLDFLGELNQPVIVPVSFRSNKHFVVFKGIVGDLVVIADPALGNYTMRVADFLAVWTEGGGGIGADSDRRTGPRRRYGVGFILERAHPQGPLTEEDRARQARFMATRNLSMLVTL